MREHETNGDSFVCADLMDAFATVRAAYLANGEPRPMQRQSEGEGENR